MTDENFEEQLDDIISSGMGEFSEWHEEQLTELFEGVDKVVLEERLVAYYSEEFGVSEGISGEELNWVANYIGKKAKISFV